jgi:hypothetical protein
VDESLRETHEYNLNLVQSLAKELTGKDYSHFENTLSIKEELVSRFSPEDLDRADNPDEETIKVVFSPAMKRHKLSFEDVRNRLVDKSYREIVLSYRNKLTGATPETIELFKKQEKTPVFPSVDALRKLQEYDQILLSTDQCIQKDETDTTLGDVLPDPNQNVMESVGYNHLNKQLMALLKEAIPAEDEFGMFCMKHGLTGDGKCYSLQEIADFYRNKRDIGRERIRQIIDRIQNWLQIGYTIDEDGNKIFYINRLLEMSLLLPGEG